ncbi:hypothetical protein DAPPUDRAFT_42769 [Daphnia pulex]|uniref:Uncharacterized protein n=1 Tax=Daphnia pulex TaxID=6669 RepID=E9FYH5_DAPPU|nr:hypothetical protein DAPPUDRAFT_42769 [Daphnia pulex]|eukprot:EFX87766.1 hypothetical protein DAPPUDRAFT_42769 [Daphnia pulex]
MSANDELVANFREVTGIDEQRARFYLESSGWQLETALASFFENDGAMDRQAGDGEDEPVEVPSNQLPEPPSRGAAAVHKLVEMNSSSDSDEEGQAFYVGGSERSGQQVIGPPRNKGKPSGDLIGDMFKSAREHGAEVLEKGASTSTKGNQTFKGTGYRLGQSEEDTQGIIPGARQPEQPRTVVLKLWKTGFSLDEGPVRDYQNPANKDFLEYIKRGEVPMELIRESRGREVHLQMEDHRTEEFISKKMRFQAFGGEGQVLGNPAPSVSQNVAASAVAPTDLAACEQKATVELKLVESEPASNVQIRLADGSRLIGRFNHTHTVGEVRQYITTARPQYNVQAFALLTTYPSRELKDDDVTLQDASLVGGTIMQRLK